MYFTYQNHVRVQQNLLFLDLFTIYFNYLIWYADTLFDWFKFFQNFEKKILVKSKYSKIVGSQKNLQISILIFLYTFIIAKRRKI